MVKGHTDYYDYYKMGWELPLLDLCDWNGLSRSPMGLRILCTIESMNLDDEQPYAILDLGCGVGTTSILIGKRHEKCRFCCIDVSQRQLKAGKKHVDAAGISDRFYFLAADVTKTLLKCEGFFDFVIATEIIEHLENPEPLLYNAHNLGRNNALYVFSVPMGREEVDNPIRYRILTKDGNDFVTDKLDKIEPHAEKHEFYHKSYTKKEILVLLNKCGYYVVKTAGADAFASSTLGYAIKRISRNSYLLDKCINKITCSRYANTLVIVCRKR